MEKRMYFLFRLISALYWYYVTYEVEVRQYKYKENYYTN